MSSKQSEIAQKVGKTGRGPRSRGRAFAIASLKPSAHGIKMTIAPCTRLAFRALRAIAFRAPARRGVPWDPGRLARITPTYPPPQAGEDRRWSQASALWGLRRGAAGVLSSQSAAHRHVSTADSCRKGTQGRAGGLRQKASSPIRWLRAGPHGSPRARPELPKDQSPLNSSSPSVSFFVRPKGYRFFVPTYLRQDAARSRRQGWPSRDRFHTTSP
jgi:hypothetical protein